MSKVDLNWPLNADQKVVQRKYVFILAFYMFMTTNLVLLLSPFTAGLWLGLSTVPNCYKSGLCFQAIARPKKLALRLLFFTRK